ncbi:MAG: hypothetical protein A2X23_05365 [Chloroflexi bacterium GWC2_73_18]|nr:MAG: hypothetical protein A2X23_05365 [Chloroflexi bacterium GWC2_73_18]
MTETIPPAALAAVVGGLLAAAGVAAWIACGPPGSRTDPATPGRLFVLAYAILYAVGSVWIVATGESRGAGPLLTGGGLAAFALGALASRHLRGAAPARPVGLAAGRFRTSRVLALAVIGLIALLPIVLQWGIPFFADSVVTSRRGYAGPLFDLFRWLLPPAALVAVAVALARRRRSDLLVAAGVAGATVVLELALASRALPAELGVTAFLLAWWSGWRVRPRTVIALGVASVVAFAAVQVVRVATFRDFETVEETVVFGVKRTVDRVVLIQPRTLEVLATRIPGERPYALGGTYLRWLSPLLGGEAEEPLGTWAYRQLFPQQDPPGFASPGLLGELWANWGPFALAGMFAFGIAAQRLGGLTASVGPAAEDAVFAAVVAVAFARAYATSLNGLLLSLAAILAWRIVVTAPERPPWLRFPRLR